MTEQFAGLNVVLILISICGEIRHIHTQDDIKALCAAAQKSCRACIVAHPQCTWCTEQRNNTICGQSRCMILSENERGCPSGFVDNPKSTVSPTQNTPFSTTGTNSQAENPNITQLRPQKFNIQLRPGQSQKVNVTFRRVVEYPLDLYYVMDLSYSMNDDLQTLQNLGSNLVRAIRNVSENVRFGFGSFVDKVMMPYTSTDEQLLQDPCFSLGNATCSPAFGFHHQLPITSSDEAFREAVRATNISGNVDRPEGGFDALMQIAVCQEQVKWRDISLRVILFTTDAPPHIAMDGKLATILDINDMQCSLEKNVNVFLPNALVYAKSRIQDYPSIGQLQKVFEDNKIQTIFAVTQDVLPLYEELPTVISNSFVDTLESDSSNVITVLSRSYESIRRKLQLNPPSTPSNVDMKYRVLCPRAIYWADNSLQCDNVSNGDEAVFQFELTAKSCPSSPGRIDVIDVTSASITDIVTMTIEYICNCECSGRVEKNSTHCNGKGELECGRCSCNPGVLGEQCQCRASTCDTPIEQQCLREKFVEGATLCSGRGCCECGQCLCEDGYHGDYCQCTRTGCPDVGGNLCGGPEQGICQNCDNSPVCLCNSPAGWGLDRRGVCTCNINNCRNGNSRTLCSNNGECECNNCVCDKTGQYDLYKGKYCGQCAHPSCSVDGTCDGAEVQACARCVYEQGRQNEDVIANCQSVCEDQGLVSLTRQSSLPDCTNCLLGSSSRDCLECRDFNQDSSLHVTVTCSASTSITNCMVTYMITWSTSRLQYLVYVRQYERAIDCPELDPLLIVIPVAGGVVLLGLSALLLWKICQTLRDKREYEQFVAEAKSAQWAKMENPIFSSPTSRFVNPGFVDDGSKVDIR